MITDPGQDGVVVSESANWYCHLGIQPRLHLTTRDAYSFMLIAALFIIARYWKQPMTK